ncbi:thiolase family protein [Aneurinibacillus sp. Ricciae_BoGa-3]|uniref:thiolase family protein n=1 Tax=Aneurinibacillus sp. Ricciae_BoGa-3 TaxID=3022697 RepID=UPI0023425957|nr:thiolase family protein [Aneurinibacillus sp. Ricciae_BoGa-3]WCK55330.1 thiolase family protein [Aneurinibacillus sp. Ricciae_BoGa-3]
MNDVYLISARRTPIGKAGGILKDVEPEKLAAAVFQEVLKETGLRPEQVEQVVLGNVVGPGGNLARLSALEAGLPFEVPGLTVDMQCGSGLEAIRVAACMIQAGAADIVIAGGVESCSLAPWKMEKPRNMYGMETPRVFARARFAPDTIGDPDMGIAAENVAARFGVSREDQDTFALRSHQKAVTAMEGSRFADEMVPIPTPSRKEPERVAVKDEGPRPDTSLAKLQALKPVFLPNGTVTAGNACGINDGAAAVLLVSGKKARELGLTPALEYIDAAAAGVDPNILGIGPVPAVRKLLGKHGLTVDQLDRVEFNEAFASQVLASIRELGIDEACLNKDGGALALGHPYGASGAILVTRLLHGMKAEIDSKWGLATMGIGGGLGIAALFKKWEGWHHA